MPNAPYSQRQASFKQSISETDMELKIDNKDYKIIIASDVIRDGIGLEIWDTETNKMIIEIFRADSDQRFDFYTEKITVPIELIEKALEIFNQRIGKEFQNMGYLIVSRSVLSCYTGYPSGLNMF